MAQSLKTSILASLSSSGLPQLDYPTFTEKHYNFPNGVRAVLTRGTLPLSLSGVMESKDVVLKTISANFSYRCSEERKDKLLQYFEREAGIWRHSVSHPNILELYGYMTVPNDIFPSLVSPFYPEGNLRNFVEARRNHGLPAKQRIELTRDIARGIDFLHSLSPIVVHRDVRASNVLVGKENGVLSAILIDFGSAKLSDPQLFPILNSTHTNTKAWSPPEYIQHTDQSASPTTYGDIWSLACTCLEIFTGADPYPEWCNIEDAHLNGELPERPPEEFSHMNDSLWSLLEQCWNETPELRPSAKVAAINFEKLTMSM